MVRVIKDKIVYSPKDVDDKVKLIQKELQVSTKILGAFNPGFTELPNGNYVIMIRMAEALQKEDTEDEFLFLRWDKKYIVDAYEKHLVDAIDPRKYIIDGRPALTYRLSSVSWLLPVELSRDDFSIVKVHVDKAIEPENSYQEFGVEDARITKIENTYYMTACSVSSERHSTVLYESDNGLDYQLKGIIFDHQNKDVLLFPQKIQGKYYAITRPVGACYFDAFGRGFQPGPSIKLAESPDLLHWKPVEDLFFHLPEGEKWMRIGGSAPPILIDKGWLFTYHLTEKTSKNVAGIYKTYWAILDKENPAKVLYRSEKPLLEPNRDIMKEYIEMEYLDNIVFTTGIVKKGNTFVIASGESDLCCRITEISDDFLEEMIQ